MVTTKLRVLNPKSTDTKYTGFEPDWTVQPTPENRQSSLMKAFGWYSYHYDKKTVKQLVLDWMMQHAQDQHRAFARVPESALSNVLGWLCRMNQRGLVLQPNELEFIRSTISQHVAAASAIKHMVDTSREVQTARVTIQDRLHAKAEEIIAELEGLYDDVIRNDARMTADHKPIAVIRGMNLPPQMVPMLRDIWMSRLDELTTVQAGRDSQLAEGYGNFTKVQIRNLIKLTEQVLADCASYVQIKKVEKKPRKSKPVSAEHKARKFKHLLQFDELQLTGLPAAKLVDASEAWLYDTKKRKLIHLVADAHIGSVTVKNNMLIGLGETDSQQKTLRKPSETIKALLSASKPNARKVFKDVKTTETAFNGRGSDTLMILRVW